MARADALNSTHSQEEARINSVQSIEWLNRPGPPDYFHRHRPSYPRSRLSKTANKKAPTHLNLRQMGRR
jgi:hypothetical protein